MPSLRDATVTIQIARAIFGDAASRGHALPSLCERFGVDRAALEDVDGRIPAKVLIRIWEEVPVLCGDPDYGLHLAEKAAQSASSVIGYIFQSSATVREGMVRAVRFQRLLQDVKDTRLEEIPGGLRITHGVSADDPAVPRHAVEFGIAMAVVLAERATGVPVKPVDVAFEGPTPASLAEHLRIFGVRPRFGVDVNHIVFENVALSRPIRTADSALCELLERHAREMLAKVPEHNDVRERVRRGLCEALRGGDPSLEALAVKLRTTPRTLQRQLRQRGTSFQKLLDEVRHDLALRYLRDGQIGLEEIGFLLGFNDASAFHRAFVRWTGKRPGMMRREAGELGR